MSNKRSTEDALEILKEIVRQGHADAVHSGGLSRMKSIFGLQRTSVGMLLDSILESFGEYATVKQYKKAETIIKLDLKNADMELWENYQKNDGDYPPEFEILLEYMMEVLIGEEK
tara:strand:+ start:133 stop:477 length:345 start_codon:yes stop_codon:yes gene_type:complete